MSEQAQGIAEALLELERVHSALLRQASGELSSAQFAAMAELGRFGELPTSQLARRLGIAPSTLTRIADNLVRLGYLERRGIPDDRRVVLLGLTDMGRERLVQMQAAHTAAIASAFRRLEIDMDYARECVEGLVKALREALWDGEVMDVA